MVNKWVMAVCGLLVGAGVAWAAVELDVDNNGGQDIAKGGTNATSAAGARANLAVKGTAEFTAYSTSRAAEATAMNAAIATKAATSSLTSHTGNTSNPHGVTATQVGLGNVNNTSDANKPVSTAQQTALDGKASSSDARFPTTAEKAAMTAAALPSADNPFATRADLAFLNYSATSVSVTAGGTVTGTLHSTHGANDTSAYQVQEASGTPGFDVRFTFAGSGHFNQVSVRFQYDGATNHDLYVQIYNYGSTQWDNLHPSPMHGTTNYAWVSFAVPDNAAYVSGGAPQVRFYHSTAGNPSHALYVDYIVLQHSTMGGATTLHSALTGRSGADQHPMSAITGLDNYTSAGGGRMTKTNPYYTGTLTDENPDGEHRLNVRNTVSRTYTPAEGDFDTDADGKLWIYQGGAWVEKGATYTPSIASGSVAGVVKVGPGLSVDGAGVLSAMAGSLTSSGLITAGLAGNVTISTGFAYVTSAAFDATFSGYSSSKQAVIFASYSGHLCAALGSKLYWSNPVTFTNQSSACAKVQSAATPYVVAMWDGKTLVHGARNLQKIAASVPVAPVYAFSETWDGASLCATSYTSNCDNTWTVSAGTGTLDFADTTLTNNLLINGVSGTASAKKTFTAWATTYGYLNFRQDTDNNDSVIVVRFKNTTDTVSRLYIYYDTANDRFRLSDGTVSAYTPSGSAVPGVAHHLWWDFSPGTGSNSAAHLYVSSTATKPDIPSASFTTGVGTQQLGAIYLEANGANAPMFGRLILNDTAIGSNP